MKAGVLAVAAAMASGVIAAKPHAARRHAHQAFHVERAMNLTASTAPEPTCGCTTIYTTITGAGSLYFPPPPPTAYSSMAPPPKPTATATYTPPGVVPTPFATTCPTTGVYTIPATTITLTESTTVCGATSTKVPAGSHTAGGVTTVVTQATTVTCPYATVQTSTGVVTSTILTTTYVCPSAGTYTIAPMTTSCSKETVWVYPTPATYAPGTYTRKEVVTTVTETDYVFFCPYTSEAPAPTYAPVVTYKPVVAPPPTTQEAPKSTPVKAPTNSGGLGNSGHQWAITYSPYENNGQCKDAGSVASDIAMIASKGFSSVRVYSTDCSGLENIGAACEAHGLKMIIGIFITSSGCSGAQEQVNQIIAWGKWSLVELVVVGNEAIFSGFASAGEMAAFISSCRSSFQTAGYSGPCTTTEPLNIWQENAGTLCGAVDVVGCNIHPFFNSNVDSSHAGSFVASQLSIVDGLCPGKTGINLETGWPSDGDCNGLACPTPEDQAIAVKSIAEQVGGKSVMFSFVNDLWKEKGAFKCEQSWGVISVY